MIDEICGHIKNYFCDDKDKHFGIFVLKADGTISRSNGAGIAPIDFLKEGQYFRIIGSDLNDGVYSYPNKTLKAETFDGAIWAMKVPQAFFKVVNEIQTYQESDEAKPSAYTSESFGGYSYSKATGTDGAPIGWQQVFAKRLNQWRKI